jgi:hypothetical protein
MKAHNSFGISFLSQAIDIVSDKEIQNQQSPEAPPASAIKPRLPISGAGPRHQRNFTHLPQLRDHPFSKYINAKAERNIDRTRDLAAKENNARSFQDVAVDALKKVPMNQRLACLRNMGGSKAMQETMRSGSAEAIEAWMEVIELLPETSRFVFLSERLNENQTEYQGNNGDFISDLASDITKKMMPTAVHVTAKDWMWVENASGTPVPVAKIVEEAGWAITENLKQNLGNGLVGQSAKFFLPVKKERDQDSAVVGDFRLAGKVDFDFSYEHEGNKEAGSGDGNSIAVSIFSNLQPDAMKAWGKILALVPDRNRERSQLLFARTEHVAGPPALALLLERGEKQALDQFVDLAKQHVWHGDDDIHYVLFDCLPALKILTSQRGEVSGREALSWVREDGLKYINPHQLSLNSQGIAQAYGKLMQLVPGKYRNDIFFPESVWGNFPVRDGDGRQLNHHEARELAHLITLMKAMVPTMNGAEREQLLNEIRSRHAAKTLGFWKNTSSYERFKKAWPAVDAMLLDLKAELKTAL